MHSFDIAIHPEELKHCPRCGEELVWQQVAGRMRPVCKGCGFTFFFNLKVGAGVLVAVGGKVLLTRRAIPPGKGEWCLPAGFVEYDDSVWRSIRERRPFMLDYSLSRSAKEVEVFTENLLKGKEIKLSRN